MATVFAHAALPFIAARALKRPPAQTRRLAVAGAVLASVADLDMLGVLFDIQHRDSWGHRGATHSVVFAAALTLLTQILWPPVGRRDARAWLWLFGCAASHGLIDAMTHGELGVALLAPLRDERTLFPFNPVAVSPLGANELFSRWGALVLLNEMLALVVPAALAVALINAPDVYGRGRILGSTLAWAAICVALHLSLPGFFAPLPRVLETHRGADDDERLGWIPTAPDAGLMVRYEDLKAAGLFDRELTADRLPWSSSFFPWWYGGEAGRWQDPRPLLIWRTLAGFEPESPQVIRQRLDAARSGDAAAQRFVERLSPTEKYDLAAGDLELPATRLSLASTHNGHPRYWYGLCNGVAAAAIDGPEPVRVVDAKSPRGDIVRFFPQDIKALLAAAYFETTEVMGPRFACGDVSLDSGKGCSLNAATTVLATLNSLGLARRAFMVDAVPTRQVQFYPVAAARVSLLRGPYPYDGSPTLPELEGRLESLIEVELTYTLSSTTLGYDVAHRFLASDPTRVQPVGLVPVRLRFSATLGLDAAGQIVAGRWTGRPADGIDTILVHDKGPALAKDAGFGALSYNPHLRWPIVAALARASVSPAPGVAEIDVADLVKSLGP